MRYFAWKLELVSHILWIVVEYKCKANIKGACLMESKRELNGGTLPPIGGGAGAPP